MTQIARDTRKFSVHPRDMDRHLARVLEEASFEAAAVAYLEDLHFPNGETGEVTVVVREVGTGHERCFRIDLGSGETAACP